jgi:quercetin dioxygenase-like cupin family protein
MSTTTFAEFEAHARAAGAYEVLERRWAAGQVLAEHTHPFAVQALVVEGEFWLDCGGRTQHLRAGDRFSLAAEQPHAERYGPEGAVFWAARHR